MKFMACQSCFNCRIDDGDCAINDEIHGRAREGENRGRGGHRLADIHDADEQVRLKISTTGFFPLMDANCRPRFGIKKMLTVYSQGMDDPHMFDSYFEYTAAMFPSFGFDLMDNMVCTRRQRSGERRAQCGAEDSRLRIGQGSRAVTDRR